MRFLLTFVIFLGTSATWARVCTLDEIRQIDTKQAAEMYSPFRQMTQAALVSSVLPLVVNFEEGESSTFWTVNFFGIGGWIYLGAQSLSEEDCEDERTGGRIYRPALNELIQYHHQQKDLFYKTYTWMSLWMLGIVTTTETTERRTAAIAALAVPWAFAFSKSWSAFTEDSELQLTFLPMSDGKQTILMSGMQFTF